VKWSLWAQPIGTEHRLFRHVLRDDCGRLETQPFPIVFGQRVSQQLAAEPVHVAIIDDDPFATFDSGAHHCRTANVDPVSVDFVEGLAELHHLRERIEGADQKLNLRPSEPIEFGKMLLFGQKASMQLRGQGHDSVVEHWFETSDVGTVDDLPSGGFEKLLFGAS